MNSIPNSKLLDSAREGSRYTHPLLALLLTLLLGFLAAQIVGFLLALLMLSAIFPGGSGSLLSYAPTSSAYGSALALLIQLGTIAACTFLFVWVWVTAYEKRPVWSLGLSLAGAPGKYLRGLVVGVAMFAVAVLVMALFGYVSIEQDSGSVSQGVVSFGAVLLVYLPWMLQGPGEEVLIRGFLLQSIGTRWGVLAGIIITSLIFAALHSLNPNISPVAVLNLVLVGVFLAVYALQEGSLWGVFAWHSAWNWTQGNLLGFQVSGGDLGGGTLLDLEEAGPDTFTGGAFGPEGGFVVTIVLAVAILAFLLWSKHAPGRWLVAGERSRR